MAYPAGTPVDEQILQDLEATLAAIAAPSFHFDVAQVLRADALGAGLRFVELPGILIGTPTYVWDDKTNPLYAATMTVALHCELRSIETLLADQAWLAADVRQALLADVSRGGVAVDTKILSHEPYLIFNEASAVSGAGIDVVVQIRFRHLFTDPNTAR